MRMTKQSIGRVSVLAFCVALASVSSLPLWADDRAFVRPNMTQDNSNKPIFADKRVALVIGNSRYKDSPLKNPINDAKAMRDKLSALGFDVIYREDLKQAQIGSTLSEFEKKLSAGAISVFFYAGHGLQVDGKNYLPVTDASINNEYDVPNQSLNANLVLQIMDKAKSKVNILFLDACRNNPYARSFRSANSGLAPMSSPLGTIVSFATRAGEVASDGNGNNGLYTEQLLKLLDKPNLPVDQVIKRASKAVIEASGGKQVPEMSVQLYDDFYLVQQSSNLQGGAIVPNMAADDTLWYSIKDSTKVTDFERYIKEFVTGQYVVQAKEKLATLKNTKPTMAAKVDLATENKALNSVRFLEELEDFVKRDAKPITTLQAQIAAGSQLAKARYCALATHERFKLGLKAEAGIDYCKELAEQGVGIGQALYGRAFLNGISVAQDEQQAIFWIQKAAENNQPEGQQYLADLYYHANGVPQDFLQAVKWYNKAAEQGMTSAQYNLGVIYEEGQGVAKDDAKAVEWYRKAAYQGMASAQYNLGAMYEEGQGVAKDEAKAVEWYFKAAEQGEANAQNSLGLMYKYGKGVAQDYFKAMEWFRKAANQGWSSGQFNLGVMYADGQSVAKDEAKAIEWYRKAAEQGKAEAQHNLGVMYHYGRGVPKDYIQAVEWYRRAAEQKLAKAQYGLGLMYINGTGVPQDDVRAAEWFTKAAKLGYVEAQNYLGVMYANGQGVVKDEVKAVEWYRDAAEQGDANAQYNLGMMYKDGTGVEKDEAKAVELIRAAAEKNSAIAQYRLALMYHNGDGLIPKDINQAITWYQKAVDQGHSGAQFKLAKIYLEGDEAAQNIPLGQSLIGLSLAQLNEDAINYTSMVLKKTNRGLDAIKGFAESGYPVPQLLYGTLYESGQMVIQDYAKAAYWYRKSAEQGNVLATKYLADMYEYGKGVRKDLKEAIRLYKIASDNGNAEAQAALTRLGQ